MTPLARFLAVVFVCVTAIAVAGIVTDDPAPTPSRVPVIEYVPCAPGGVHAWVYGDDLEVMPAGSECP